MIVSVNGYGHRWARGSANAASGSGGAPGEDGPSRVLTCSLSGGSVWAVAPRPRQAGDLRVRPDGGGEGDASDGRGDQVPAETAAQQEQAGPHKSLRTKKLQKLEALLDDMM